jgi:hypothetical protein
MFCLKFRLKLAYNLNLIPEILNNRFLRNLVNFINEYCILFEFILFIKLKNLLELNYNCFCE